MANTIINISIPCQKLLIAIGNFLDIRKVRSFSSCILFVCTRFIVLAWYIDDSCIYKIQDPPQRVSLLFSSSIEKNFMYSINLDQHNLLATQWSYFLPGWHIHQANPPEAFLWDIGTNSCGNYPNVLQTTSWCCHYSYSILCSAPPVRTCSRVCLDFKTDWSE